MISKVSDTMDEKYQKVLWQHLPFDQFNKIQNPELRKEYMVKRNKMVRYIINPLYTYAIRNGYDDNDFNKAQTIYDMVQELKKFYDSKSINRNGIEEIIKESIRKK